MSHDTLLADMLVPLGALSDGELAVLRSAAPKAAIVCEPDSVIPNIEWLSEYGRLIVRRLVDLRREILASGRCGDRIPSAEGAYQALLQVMADLFPIVRGQPTTHESAQPAGSEAIWNGFVTCLATL